MSNFSSWKMILNLMFTWDFSQCKSLVKWVELRERKSYTWDKNPGEEDAKVQTHYTKNVSAKEPLDRVCGEKKTHEYFWYRTKWNSRYYPHIRTEIESTAGLRWMDTDKEHSLRSKYWLATRNHTPILMSKFSSGLSTITGILHRVPCPQSIYFYWTTPFTSY